MNVIFDVTRLRARLGSHRAPKDHINMRILQHMIFGIPLILGLGTRIVSCISCPFFLLVWDIGQNLYIATKRNRTVAQTRLSRPDQGTNDL